MKKPRFDTESLPAGWPALEQRLRSAEMVAPRAGFAGRWLARAAGMPAAYKPAAYKPGALAWLGLAGGAVLSLSLLAALVSLWLPLAQLQPGALLTEVVRFATDLAITLRVLLTTWMTAGLLALMVLLALPGIAYAAPAELPALDEVVFGRDFTLASGRTINGDLVVLGGSLTMEEDSTVTGQAVVIGGNAIIITSDYGFCQGLCHEHSPRFELGGSYCAFHHKL